MISAGPDRIWIDPQVAMGLGDRPRYGYFTNYVKGSVLEDKVIEERKRCAEVAASFIHNRLYVPDFPVCSYHHIDIFNAVMCEELTLDKLPAGRERTLEYAKEAVKRVL